MNCQEVQERLSEYLDRSLDSESLRNIETHLSSCHPCGAEAEALALCIESVANLPSLDPPIGFAQRVMSHVREIEAKPSFWQRWWLAGKIPLHVTALALIGILTVYLFEKEQAHQDLLPPAEPIIAGAPSQEPSSPPSAPPAASEQAKTEDSSAAPQAPRRSTANETARTGRGRGSTEKKPPLSASTVARNPIGVGPLFEDPGPGGLLSPVPVELGRRTGGIITGTPVMNPAPPRIGAGPFSLPSELEADSFRVPPFARLADYELVMRRRPAQQDLPPMEEAVQGNLDRLMATIPDSTRPHIVWVSLAPGQLDEFKRGLLSIGTIEAESATSYRDLEFASKTGSEILIRLTVLPAIEANRSAPTSRAIR